MIDENRFLRGELKKKYGFDNIVGSSPEVQRAYVMAAQVAPTNATVLILGETGTGKEYLARTIHYQSNRADGPFVKVNCAALPENLLESELFGHEKGAFTHAVAQAHRAVRDRAQGHHLPRRDRRDHARGAGQAAARAAGEAVRAGRRQRDADRGRPRDRRHQPRPRPGDRATSEFREDLYYRLNVITLKLPPIRERGDDVEVFAHHFLESMPRRPARV